MEKMIVGTTLMKETVEEKRLCVTESMRASQVYNY